MKKLILSIAIIATVAFVACSDDENGNCATCETAQVEVCDNGNGTATVTVAGLEQDPIAIPEGSTVQDIADGFCAFVQP